MNIEKRGRNDGLSSDRFKDDLISLANTYRSSVKCPEQEDWVREKLTRRRRRGSIRSCFCRQQRPPPSYFSSVDDDVLSHYEANGNEEYNEEDEDNNDDRLHQISLTPTLFWYDSMHMFKTSQYRYLVFKPKYCMVAREGSWRIRRFPPLLIT